MPPVESDNQEEETPGDQPEETPPVTYAKLVISELFVDPKQPQTDANDEFIELYNPGQTTLQLKNYILQTGSSLQYSYTFESGSVAPKAFKAFKITQTGVTLANSGGRAQVLDPNNQVAAPLVTYGAAKSGQSFSLFDDGFEWTSVVSPGRENVRPAPRVVQVKSSSTSSRSSSTKPKTKTTYPTVLITEALPDPSPPDLDKTHEFVELYNPNSFPVLLEGYKLKTGKTLSSNQTLGSLTINPGQYIALFSSDNRMTLSNSGGQVQLQDPNGKVLSSAEVYGDAPEGAAWAKVGSGWQWSSKPTPAAKNIAASVASGSDNSSPGTQEPSPNGGLSPELLSSVSHTATIPVRPTNTKLVGGAIALAVLYGLYEFKHDLRVRINQSRSYLKTWRNPR